MKTVFISHASKDREVADAICAMLEERGLECWIAPRDIKPGRDYGEEIINGIESTTVTVLILSENANDSTFVKKEIERAVSKSKAVFPVRIREVFPAPGLELFISSAHWVDAWQSPMDAKIDQLANSIRPLIGQPVRVLSAGAKSHGKRVNYGMLGAVAALVFAALGVGMFISRPAASPVMLPLATAAPARDNPAPDVAKLKPAPAPTTALTRSAPATVVEAPPRSIPLAATIPATSQGEAGVSQPASATTASAASRFAGVWVGQYVCAQGATGLRLNLSEIQGERLRGEFQFYPLPGRHAPSGSFHVTGVIDGQTVTLNAGQWIRRPAGYDAVDLVATLQEGSPSRLTGHVLYAGCGALSVQQTAK